MNRQALLRTALARFGLLAGAKLTGCSAAIKPAADQALRDAMLQIGRQRRIYRTLLLSFIDQIFDEIAAIAPPDEPMEITAAGLINSFIKLLLSLEFGIDRAALLPAQVETIYSDLPAGFVQRPAPELRTAHNEGKPTP